MANKYKRRNFIQKELSLYKSIFSFLIMVGLGVAILTIFYSIFSINMLSYIIDSEGFKNQTGSLLFLYKILGSYWFYIIIGGMSLICLATFFTHRFAGPLYRFENSFDRMINNDFSFQIVLRKNDEAKELAEKINQFNAKLSSTIKTIVFLTNEVENNHLTLRKAFAQDNNTLEQAISLNRKLKKIVSAYKYE